MTAVAAQDLLAAWDRLARKQALHWDARNAALLDAFAVPAARDTAGARQAALLQLYAASFGEKLDGVAGCPHCGTEVELNVPVAELVEQMPQPLGPEPLEIDGEAVQWRLPGAEDLAASARCADPAQGAVLLLTRMVGSDGAQLSETARSELARRVAAADPFADITFELTCPQCAASWESPLDIGEFVWAALRSTARRLLGEVDELARAYGWSETQILALSQARRAYYLELVRDE
ncbi:hypothetical protein Rhe02_49360 [Rhizocola hellebori]|uniref:Phage baseplate protein n=1 Tax=Rhizocola hellebori TaxID=1392758 RepID=A0A8J3QA12_9ACTN|nr:hypothetical protein [Rhizocola hellebori]GIH06869.1 hypothetical protein Rhe02_49360 [Rhizocola hellebori]